MVSWSWNVYVGYVGFGRLNVMGFSLCVVFVLFMIVSVSMIGMGWGVGRWNGNGFLEWYGVLIYCV